MLIGTAHLHIGRIGLVDHTREFIQLRDIIPFLGILTGIHDDILPAVALTSISIHALIVLYTEGRDGIAKCHLEIVWLVGRQRTAVKTAHIGAGLAVVDAGERGGALQTIGGQLGG